MTKALLAAVAFSVVLSASASAATQATPSVDFALTDVTPVHQLAGHDEGHKCGGDHKCGKDGEHKCGADDDHDHKCGGANGCGAHLSSGHRA